MKKGNSIWKKDSDSAINKEYKYVFTLLAWQQIHGKLGLKIGLDFSGTSNHCFWHYSPIYLSKLAQKPHISTQFDEIYLLVRDLTKTDGKKIWPIFVVRVPPLVKKSQKNFFFKYGQITHQSIDLVELSKNVWCLRCFLFIFEWFVSKIGFLRFLKSLVQFSSPISRGFVVMLIM